MERNYRTRKKMISDPQELYGFLATPDIKVTNIMFASDDVVWASRRYIAEKKIPRHRHTQEVKVSMSRPEREFIFTVISTGCNRQLCILTLTL